MSQYTEETFLDIFHSIARPKHRYEVFSDCITCMAISLHNSVCKSETLEAEYMDIIGKYTKEEASKIAKLFAILIELLEPEPRDILGQIFMKLELANRKLDQFFTPPELSNAIAQLLSGGVFEDNDEPFIRLSDPASGAGGMILAYVKAMTLQGKDPAQKLWVQCIDIDRVSALMCYIQLTLWNVPAEIIVGNTLSMEFRETYYTPAHYLYDWPFRLRVKKMFDILLQVDKDFESKTESKNIKQPDAIINLSTETGQLDLF